MRVNILFAYAAVVTAVVWSGLPGQEAGNSLVDVLYGDVNPSGRLPYTIAKNRKDYGVDVLYQNVSAIAEINYHEGTFCIYFCSIYVFTLNTYIGLFRTSH